VFEAGGSWFSAGFLLETVTSVVYILLIAYSTR
jgi:hypothetical protein